MKRNKRRRRVEEGNFIILIWKVGMEYKEGRVLNVILSSI